MIDMSEPAAPVAAAGDPAPVERKTFEDWVTAKKIAAVDPSTGRASGVVRGKRRFKTSAAALVNAARSKGSIPIGRLMTEGEFNQAMNAARNITLRSSHAPR
jgi:hypothetical protein